MSSNKKYLQFISKMKKMNTNLLYLCLHNLLKRRYGFNREITRKELFCELGKHYLVPKKLRPVIIKEMEEIELIKLNDNGTVLILKCEFDLEDNANDFYKHFKIF